MRPHPVRTPLRLNNKLIKEQAQAGALCIMYDAGEQDRMSVQCLLWGPSEVCGAESPSLESRVLPSGLDVLGMTRRDLRPATWCHSADAPSLSNNRTPSPTAVSGPALLCHQSQGTARPSPVPLFQTLSAAVRSPV